MRWREWRGDSEKKTEGKNTVESGKDERVTVTREDTFPAPRDERKKGKEKMKTQGKGGRAKPDWFSNLCFSLAPSSFSLVSPKFVAFFWRPRNYRSKLHVLPSLKGQAVFSQSPC